MDRKRELTSVDIAAVERELGGYRGAVVDKAYLYPDRDVVRLKCRDHDRGRVELLLEVGERKRVGVVDRDRVPDAPDRPPNFAKMLRNRVAGATLESVEQHGFDRVLTLSFEREDQSTTVVVELFGDGNLVVVDGAGEVVDCLRTVRLKSRTVAPGAAYEYPEARFDPLTVDREGFVARMEQSDADVVRTLATQLNFGGLYGEEICARADVPYNQAIADTTEAEFDALYAVVDRLRERLRSGDLDPRVYYDEPDGQRVDATPIALVEYEDRHAEPFEDFLGALDDYFHHLDADDGSGEARDDDGDSIEAEIAKHERIIEQQQGAIEEFEAQAERAREKAELCYANYDLVDEVLTTVTEARAAETPWDEIAARFEEGAEQGIAAAEAVRDVEGAEGTVTLDLEGHDVTLYPHDGVEKNADRLYREAKRIEEKKAGAQEAIEETRAELEALRERAAADADEGSDGDDDGGTEEGPTDWLNEPSIPVRAGEHWYEQFRWFHTSDGFLVIGGRNAEDNEAIVEKYLEPGDRFFHAEAHGGPATVLKATGPSEPAKEVDFPESTLQQAAAFAVSYASVWKDGRFAGDAYAVDPDQVSKTPEHGEYLEKGGFAIRGDRTYYRDVAVDVAVGIACEDETRVLGGPSAAIEGQTATSVRLEPGQFAQNDAAKKVYREFKHRFADEGFVRKVASPDLIQEFLPPGGSRIVSDQ